jgi:hypothetical protein
MKARSCPLHPIRGPREIAVSGGPAKFEDAEHIATAKRMKADGHTGKGHRQVPRGQPGDAV